MKATGFNSMGFTAWYWWSSTKDDCFWRSSMGSAWNE